MLRDLLWPKIEILIADDPGDKKRNEFADIMMNEDNMHIIDCIHDSSMKFLSMMLINVQLQNRAQAAEQTAHNTIRQHQEQQSATLSLAEKRHAELLHQAEQKANDDKRNAELHAERRHAEMLREVE